MADELTPQEKQEAIDLLREEKKDLATSIGLMKQRNKAMEGVIDVEKDIKKDRRTLSTDIGNQVTSVQESMMGGVEGFVSETFGPLGGFVNLFTMGFIRRRMENAKLEKENTKETKKQNEKLLGVLADRALGAEGITREETANYDELKTAKVAEIETTQEATEIEQKGQRLKEEKEEAVAFVKGEQIETIEEDTKKEQKETSEKADIKSEVDLLSIQAGTVNLQTGAVAEGGVVTPAPIAGVAPVAKVAEGGVVTPAPIAGVAPVAEAGGGEVVTPAPVTGIAPVAPVAEEAKVAPVAISEPLTIQAPVVNIQQAGGEVVTPAPIAGIAPIAEVAGVAEAGGEVVSTPGFLMSAEEKVDESFAARGGGEVVGDVIGDVAEIAGGEVATGEGMSLDTTNQLLTDIEEHLLFLADNTEDNESRRERLRKQGAKKAGGKVDIKKEDDDGFSFGGLMGNIIAAISGALLGAVAGLSIGFLNMWKMIFKFIGGKLAKMFPNVTKMLSNIFGKGGKISKFVTAIKAFFTESKAFKTISEAFTKFKTAIKNFGTKVSNFIKPILKLFSGGAGGGMLKGFGKFGTTFKKFFGVFKTFFSKIFLPLQVIMSLFDGFFEAKDAAGKSEGMLATFFNSIIGFFGGILDGLIFGTLDLIKDGISWIAGFLGFEDVEKFLDSFSFSDMFNEFLDDIYKWFNLLFSDPVAALTNLFAGYFGAVLSVGDFILDMIKKPFVWLMELFGWDDAAAATESFSLSGWVMEKWDKVVAWITGLFAWGKKAGATEEGGWSFLTFVDSIWTSVKDWLTGLFTFASDKVETAGFAISTFISDVFKGIKEWFGSMFKFDSTSDLLSTVLNIMMWLPNLFVKAVAGITSWFAGLLGFKEESKELAKAGKEFNFGDLIMKAVKAIGKWFGDLFDDIVNFDFKSLAKSIMPDFLANMIFGDDPKAEKTAETKKTEQKVAGGEAEKALEKPDTEGMFAAILNPFRTYVKDLLAETPLIPDWVENIVMGAIPGGEVTGEGARGGIIKSRAAKGAIVTKPAYLPSSGTVVGEHSSWSGKGAAGGAIPDGPGGEAIIPLAGQAGGKILAEALAPAIAGAILNELMMARAGGAGAEGGGGQTIIQDNSTNQNVTNNTIVRSPSPSGPGLHFEGRDFVHKVA